MKLENVKVKWCFHDKVNKFGKYNVTAILSDEQAAELEAQGLDVKTDDDGNKIYSFVKAERTVKGKANSMPFFERYLDADGKKVEFEGLIPDGTHCDIDYKTYEWSVNGKSGTKAWFFEAKLLDDIMPGGALEYEKREAVVDDSPF